MDPVALFMQSKKPKKGTEKPRQNHAPADEGKGGPAGKLQQIITLTQDLLSDFPPSSEQSSQISGWLNQMTILLNKVKGMPSSEKPRSESEPEGEAPPPGKDLAEELLAGAQGALTPPAGPQSSINPTGNEIPGA